MWTLVVILFVSVGLFSISIIKIKISSAEYVDIGLYLQLNEKILIWNRKLSAMKKHRKSYNIPEGI